jgi:AraC-like DNA-binding protein
MDVMSLIKDLYNISGARVSVHDSAGEELYAYPSKLLPFCAKIQENIFTHRNCVDCDQKAYSKLTANGEPYIYRCSCGLLEAVAPIHNGGVITGYLMMGQVRDDLKGNDQHILKSSKSLFKTEEEQLEYFNKIQLLEYSKFESYARLMGVLAEYITEHNRFPSKAGSLPELIKKYIYQNFAKSVSLESIAKKFDCSKSTIMNTFRKKYGITVIAYLNQVRLEEAQKLICDTELSFKEIACECGFYDQNYFSKQFTEKFGCSPTAFRTKYKKSIRK